jgi:hypothetical protein
MRDVVARLDLPAINEALTAVESDWPRIDAELARLKIGRKDPFTAFLRANMMSAYAYLDQLLVQGIAPFSDASLEHLLGLNERVHYGTDAGLRVQYQAAITATVEKFIVNIEPILDWHERHRRHGNNPYKLAAETYVRRRHSSAAGDRDVPIGELSAGVCLQHEHAWQMREPSFFAKTLDRLGQERGRDVECASGHSGRAKKARCVAIQVAVGHGGAQPSHQGWRFSEGVGVRVDTYDARLC